MTPRESSAYYDRPTPMLLEGTGVFVDFLDEDFDRAILQLSCYAGRIQVSPTRAVEQFGGVFELANTAAILSGPLVLTESSHGPLVWAPWCWRGDPGEFLTVQVYRMERHPEMRLNQRFPWHLPSRSTRRSRYQSEVSSRQALLDRVGSLLSSPAVEVAQGMSFGSDPTNLTPVDSGFQGQ